MILQTIISEFRSLLGELKNEFENFKADIDEPTSKVKKTNQENGIKSTNNVAVFYVSMIALFAVMTACSSTAKPPKAPPPSVTVSTPLQQQIVQYDEFTGRFHKKYWTAADRSFSLHGQALRRLKLRYMLRN